MVINVKKTESSVTKTKLHFESPVIKIIMFENKDVLLTSGGFSGDDDPILPKDIF